MSTTPIMAQKLISNGLQILQTLQETVIGEMKWHTTADALTARTADAPMAAGDTTAGGIEHGNGEIHRDLRPVYPD